MFQGMGGSAGQGMEAARGWRGQGMEGTRNGGPDKGGGVGRNWVGTGYREEREGRSRLGIDCSLLTQLFSADRPSWACADMLQLACRSRTCRVRVR